MEIIVLVMHRSQTLKVDHHSEVLKLKRVVKTKKLKRVVKTTLSAVTLALVEAIETCFVIKSLLCEFANKQMHHGLLTIDCYTDNKSLVDTINSTKTAIEKRLKVDVCIIRKMIEKNEVPTVSSCGSSSQLGDCFNMDGASSKKILHVLRGGANLFNKYTKVVLKKR